MDDLVIGLTKSVVAVALTNAQTAIEEANRLPESVQTDLVFITDEFQMMQSFLNVADEEGVKNIMVRTWVRQMRELAYNLEECIELVVKMDVPIYFSFLPRRIENVLVSSLIPPVMERLKKKISSGKFNAISIKQLKARVQDVSRRKPVLAQQQPVPRATVGHDTRRETVLGDLTQLITKKGDADLQVISVWGAGGGIGTTPIIRKSYSDPEISHSFTCRAWVNLTHQFCPHEFVRSLMTHFYANSYKEQQGAIIGIDVLTGMDASANQGDLLGEFVQLVDKNRYLVVVEDLSTMSEWDSIRMFLPDRKNGSRIIVSSQKYEIASLCVGHPYQVLDLLPAEHSVCAFLREVNLKTPSIALLPLSRIRDHRFVEILLGTPADSHMVLLCLKLLSQIHMYLFIKYV